MPRYWITAVLCCVVLSRELLAAPPAAADGSPKLKLTTERVVIFKDGHGLVVKAATATADAEGRVFTLEVPDGAVLGCFWAVGQDKKILAMRAEWDERKQRRAKTTPAITIPELLRANLGKNVTLELTDKTNKGQPLTQEGKLAEMLELPADTLPEHRGQPIDPAGPLPAGPVVYTTLIKDDAVTVGSFSPESIPGGGVLVRELTPRGGDFVVLTQDNDRRSIIPVAHVQAVLGGKDFATTCTREEEVFSRTKRLSFDLGKDSAGKPVSLKLFYFTAGLRWIPTYRVTGELKDKAEVALQGELFNEVTDIDHAALDLVVGVPNFRFKDTLSPLTLEQVMHRALAANPVYSNSMSQQLNNANFDNGAVVVAERPPGNVGEGLAPELSGASGEQDLFVYSLKDFTLKKTARATVPLWQQAADLRHVYTYEIHARRSRVNGGLMDGSAVAANPTSPLQITVNQIWHQLELSNNSKTPWTTGAALMLRESLPIGQDLLTYTPPGSKAMLPVTIAVDLRGTFDELEIERKANALHFDGDDFFAVKKKGTASITSFRKEKSDMRITVSTGGKVLAASDDAKIKLNDFRASDWDEPNYMRVNNHSEVAWEFTLEPGATKTLTYEETFFVR